MSEYVKLSSSAGDQYLAALADTQEQFIKAASTFSTLLPKAPAAPVPAFATDLPSAKELVEANFAFAAKLLKQQKDFSEKLFSMGPSAS